MGHMAKDCYKKQNDIMNGKLQQGNYASSSRQGDDRNEHLFMVQHMTNSVTSAKESNNVWYVNSGASNHMTGHAEWIQAAKKMEKLGFEKSEVFVHFKAFKAMVEKETGLQIKCLRSDVSRIAWWEDLLKLLRQTCAVHTRRSSLKNTQREIEAKTFSC